MSQALKNLLCAGMLVAALSGCGILRGIFGGGDAKPSVPGGNGDGYHGLVSARYYRVKANYQCNAADGTVKKTYRDVIVTYADGTYSQLGDGCSTTEKSSGQTSALDLKNDILGFQNGIYQKGN